MSHSLYNPFMPSRHLNPRASGLIVFGGGAEEGYAGGGLADLNTELTKKKKVYV